MAKGVSGAAEMSGQICLKWNSFLNNIATSFENLWEEEGLVDVTLASDGQCLTAHKVILSASSPFFKKVFQTNPCQHPVIILQDVRFTELEALLMFIYKGEVNIEQKNLAALLKAAETLQIRGLSGGDIFAKEAYKRLIETEQTPEDEDSSVTQETEEAPKKKRKIVQLSNDSILEKALTPRISRSASIGESTSSEICSKDDDDDDDDDDDADLPNPESDTVPNPAYEHRLEMKIEPFEVTVEDLQRQNIKEELQRLDTGQDDVTRVDRTIGSTPRAAVTVIASAICRQDICSRNERLESREFDNKSRTEDAETWQKSTIASQRSTDDACQGWRPETATTTTTTTTTTRTRTTTTTTTTRTRTTTTTTTTGFSSPGESRPNLTSFADPKNSEISEEYDAQTTARGEIAYPPFPCPFCDRAYASWGFRRRHIKAVHTLSPRLNCKWCSQVLPSHAAWRRHVISAHNLSAGDAHNGLLILEEAHMVLQIARPTRLDTLVNIIKQSSQHSGKALHDSE